MNHYEGIFIFDANLDAKSLQSAIQNVEDTITKEGGVIQNKEDWGRRRMAYAINKVNEGHYQFLLFDIDPLKSARIRQLFGLNEQIIRYMIVTHDPKVTRKISDREEAQPVAANDVQEPELN